MAHSMHGKKNILTVATYCSYWKNAEPDLQSLIYRKAWLPQTMLLQIITMEELWQSSNHSSNINKNHDSTPANYISIPLTELDPPKTKFHKLLQYVQKTSTAEF